MFRRNSSSIGGCISIRISLSYFLLFGLIIAVGVFIAHPVPAAENGPGESLKISRIIPSGVDVPAGRQIVFEFNRPVVPLGRMERSASEIPIRIEPALSCQWRWLNSSNLACQLDQRNAMVPATRYTITVEPGIKSEDGAELAGPLTYTFTTQRPKIGAAEFVSWLSPVVPQFRVNVDHPVQKRSLEEHLYFKAKGGGRIGAKVREDPRLAKNSPGLYWLVSPLVDLPPDQAGELFEEPGILFVRGTEPGIESRAVTSFNTLPQFRFLGVECKDLGGKELLLRPDSPVTPQMKCNPSNSVSVLFSSPVLLEELREKMVIAPVGKGEGTSNLLPELQRLLAAWIGA